MARSVKDVLLLALCVAAPFTIIAAWFFLDAWDRGWQPGDTVCLVAAFAGTVLIGLPIFGTAVYEAIDRRGRTPQAEAEDYDDEGRG